MPLDILLLLLILIVSCIAYYNTDIKEDTKWERETLREYKHLKQKYGSPNVLNKKHTGCAIWNDATIITPFTKITLNNDKIPTSYYPYPRKALVEHRIPYEIKTQEQLVSLFSLNESLSYDTLRKELVSSAESEEVNISSLAMAVRVLNGKISVANAQHLYLKDKGADLVQEMHSPVVVQKPTPKEDNY